MKSAGKTSGSWFVYMLRCGDGSLYTGITTDPGRRLAEHQSGKGARYTRSRLPVSMVWCEPCASRSEAAQREYRIKQLRPEQKQAMCVAVNTEEEMI